MNGSEQKLLTENASVGPKPSDDAADYLRHQRSKPKRVYEDAVKQEPAQAEPKSDPPPTGDGPKADNTSSAADNTESAKEFIEFYNTMQAGGFAMLAGDLKTYAQFLLPTEIKARAVHHLSKGLAKMDNPELPWWAGLIMALSFPAVLNYMAAMDLRKAKKAGPKSSAEQQRPSQAANRADKPPAMEPSVTVLDREGNPIRTARPRASKQGPKPPCAQCGNPVQRSGRKYCSQRCAGLAVSAQRRKAGDPPASPAATSTTLPKNEH